MFVIATPPNCVASGVPRGNACSPATPVTCVPESLSGLWKLPPVPPVGSKLSAQPETHFFQDRQVRMIRNLRPTSFPGPWLKLRAAARSCAVGAPPEQDPASYLYCSR